MEKTKCHFSTNSTARNLTAKNQKKPFHDFLSAGDHECCVDFTADILIMLGIILAKAVLLSILTKLDEALIKTD